MAVAAYFSDGPNTKPIIGSTIDLSFTSTSSASTYTRNAAVTTSAAGNKLSTYTSLTLLAELQGNTGGTLDIVIEGTPDGGTTWVELLRFAQIAAGAAVARYVVTLSRASESSGIVTTGVSASSIVLAANTKVGGDWTDQLRVKYFTGAGTTLGKAQVLKGYLNP